MKLVRPAKRAILDLAVGNPRRSPAFEYHAAKSEQIQHMVVG
jgi:hypothetical protein